MVERWFTASGHEVIVPRNQPKPAICLSQVVACAMPPQSSPRYTKSVMRSALRVRVCSKDPVKANHASNKTNAYLSRRSRRSRPMMSRRQDEALSGDVNVSMSRRYAKMRKRIRCNGGLRVLCCVGTTQSTRTRGCSVVVSNCRSQCAKAQEQRHAVVGGSGNELCRRYRQ